MSKNADQLLRNVVGAKDFLAKIGRSQPHFDNHSVGELRSIEVKTTIHHQEYSGATNYWSDVEFDKAFAKAIRERFPELSKRAIEMMQQEANDALVAEKAALEDRLQRIAEIEAERAPGDGLEGEVRR